jgi:hypothetical protein
MQNGSRDADWFARDFELLKPGAELAIRVGAVERVYSQQFVADDKQPRDRAGRYVRSVR